MVGLHHDSFELKLDVNWFGPKGDVYMIVGKPRRIFDSFLWKVLYYVTFGKVFHGGFEYKVKPTI